MASVQRARASRAAPVDLARARLSREIVAPIRRLHALGLELRERDLTPDELTIYCALVEQVRDAARVLRTSGDE
jgi:hypothetical protein